MSWVRRRFEHLADEVRTALDPQILGDTAVEHYSIPTLDATGAPAVQPASEIQSAKQVLRGGEVLISRLNPRKARVLRVPELGERIALASGEFVVLRPKIEPRFLEYLLLAETTRQDLDGAVQSVTRSHQRIRPEQLMKMTVRTAVDLGAQRAIADFLDAETSRIDALIAKKRRLIELLDERRYSVMHEGVSGRLTSSSIVAASVPWLEKRGTAWSEVKLTRVAALGSGHTPSRDHPEWWVDCTIPWVTTGEVSQMRSDRIEFVFETREKISALGVANSAAVVHPAGTVVLCRTASAGYSAIMGESMTTSQDFATWTCGPLLRSRFLLLCLRVMRPDLLGRLAMGSTHKTIYMPDIESIRIVLPPVAEQDRIIDAVWEQLHLLDASIDRLGDQIGLLIEHRQALITAAVTGEIEVPGAA